MKGHVNRVLHFRELSYFCEFSFQLHFVRLFDTGYLCVLNDLFFIKLSVDVSEMMFLFNLSAMFLDAFKPVPL